MVQSTSLELARDNQTNQEDLVIKGYRSGLMLLIPESGPFADHLSGLKQRLEEARDFFNGAKISFRLGRRVITEAEQKLLFDLVESFGLLPQKISEDSQFTEAYNNKAALSDETAFIDTITVKKTVRSGQRVEFEGNLVIMGDVNPGAEVKASGDIIILGKLRGTAHAGAYGNQDSRVIAWQLRPLQLRIAGVITRAPEGDSRSKKFNGPEVASIKAAVIVVEPFTVK